MSFLGLFPTPEEKAAKQASKEHKQQQKAEQKPAKEKDPKKEAKKMQWANTNEQVKFVIHGGKVQCPFASPPMADIVVIDPMRVSLQDKPMATTADTNGKVNFKFTGVCTHPSQQKPSSPPPPCKAVISLGKWKNFSDTMINNDNALLVKSTIPCMISGQDIKIIDSGQKAELTHVKPKTKRTPQIINSYWVDEQGNQIEKVVPNRTVSLIIETEDYLPDDVLTVKLNKQSGAEFGNGENELEFTAKVNGKGVAKIKNVFTNVNEALKKEPRIIETYWINTRGEKIHETKANDKASLVIRTEGYKMGDTLIVTINKKDDSKFRSGLQTVTRKVTLDSRGIGVLKNFESWN